MAVRVLPVRMTGILDAHVAVLDLACMLVADVELCKCEVLARAPFQPISTKNECPSVLRPNVGRVSSALRCRTRSTVISTRRGVRML